MPRQPQTPPPQTQPQKPPRRRKKPDVPDSRLVELRAQGMTLDQIGSIVDMTKQAVSLRLRKYNIDPEELAEFRAAKPDLLDAAQARMIEAVLDPSVIDKATLLQRATAFAIFFDKHRLQTNQSTSNLAVSGSLSQLRLRARQSRLADYATASCDTISEDNHGNDYQDHD